MMKVIILCVNYNTLDSLLRYLCSIEYALEKTTNMALTVVVADNSNTPVSNANFPNNLDIKYVFTGHNLGYLGAVSFAIKEERILLTDYDYSIISNVDVTLEPDFFKVLSAEKISNNIAWIAPQIFSVKEQRDRNPKILHRPTLRKIKNIMLTYKYPIFHYIYQNTLYRLRTKKISNPSCNEIYAGHGSFMVFTKFFFQKDILVEYPVFLFGEEIFLAELVRKGGLKVLYLKELVVYDTDHVSTKRMKRKEYYKLNYDALKVIMNMFYYE